MEAEELQGMVVGGDGGSKGAWYQGRVVAGEGGSEGGW